MKTKETLTTYYNELIPFKAMVTWYQLTNDYKKFLTDYFCQNNSEKMKPIVFFFFSYSVFLILLSIASSATPSKWASTVLAMPQSSVEVFSSEFSVTVNRADLFLELLSPGSSKISNKVRDKVGSIESDKIAEYLHKKGHDEEAYFFLKNKNFELSMSNYINTIFQALVPILIILQAVVMHEFIKNNGRTLSDTLAVLLYWSGFSLPIYGFFELILWKTLENKFFTNLALILISFYMLYKLTEFLKHTHNARKKRVILSFFLSSSIFTIPAQMLLMIFILFFISRNFNI